MMGRVFWISGIDTGIGKTIATGLIAKSLLASGHDVITVKMVQTGNDGYSEDIDLHREICGEAKRPEDLEGLTAPVIFKFPSSPLLAGRLEGKTVDLEKIAASVRACAARHEIVLVESAGGLDVPLTEEMLSADFAAREGWPLILVTCGRLGAINHTLLSLEAAKFRNLQIAGVVHNYHPDANAEIDADAVAAIERHLAKLGYLDKIVKIPRVSAGEWPIIDFSALFCQNLTGDVPNLSERNKTHE